MDKNNKEYIVTKIEKYEEMYDDEANKETIIKPIINGICLLIFVVLHTLTSSSLLGNLDTVVNQILDDVSLFGVAITGSNSLRSILRPLYCSIMGKILVNKLQKNDEESQIETLAIENNGGKTR